MHRIRAESKATKALYTKAATAVQSLVAGDDKTVWILHLFSYTGQHYLLGYEGLYLLLNINLLCQECTYLCCKMYSVTSHRKLGYRRRTTRPAMSVEISSSAVKLYEKSHRKRLSIGKWPRRSLKVTGNGVIWYSIYHLLLVFCCNNVSVLHRFQDVTTFTLYTTTCDSCRAVASYLLVRVLTTFLGVDD